MKVNAAFGGAPGGAATPHGALGDGFGYGPELLDELTRVRVIHVEVPARRYRALAGKARYLRTTWIRR